MVLFRPDPEHFLRNFSLILLAMLLVAALSLFISLNMGSMPVGASDIFHALFENQQTFTDKVILEIRLPRILSGFLVGGMLGLAGALMQVLLRNPLAEPYILGISGGAGAFAILTILAGMTGIWINLGAFVGAFFTMLLVFILSRTGGSWNPLRILLTGVVIAAGWGAIISLLLVISPAGKLHGILFWLMGDLSYAHYSWWAWLLLFVVLICSMVLARNMNLLAHSEQQAASLGVPVMQTHYFIYFAASLLAAIAVTQAGSIGFIGLIVPHICRLLFGSDHRILFPVSVCLGGSLLVFADSLARTIVAPQQLPVGVLTAMLGVPLFLFLLHATAIKQKP